MSCVTNMSLPRFDTVQDLKRRYMILDIERPCWDVKFYPYLISRDDPPIFAVVSFYCVFVYMVDVGQGGPDKELKLLAWHHITKDQKINEYRINSCVWCYIDENEPLLAVTGESGQILILKPLTGELVTTLVGHGQGVINALAAHPKYPWIIASASLDTSIRIWDLRRINDPTLSSTIIICGHGIAHKECLLTIDWHASGRYIVSGGYDYRVAVWTIPDLHPDSKFWYEISKEGRQRTRDEVRVIQYPHFLSSAVHNDVVDTVVFVGDLIVSKAPKEDKIVLWSITGFNGMMEPPDPSTAVKSREYLDTTNGFMQRPGMYLDDDFFGQDALEYKGPELFKRYLQFSIPDADIIWLGFGLSRPSSLFPEVRMTMTAGNFESKLYHWDLQSFIDGYDRGGERDPAKATSSKGKSKGKSKGRGVSHTTGSESRDTSPEARISTLKGVEGRQRDNDRFRLHDPDTLLQPTFQKIVNLGRRYHLITRAVAWSVCGRWCVAVGEENASLGDDDKGAIVLHERMYTK